MLNRLYIVVGVIAILILAAAFIVPSFIPWGNYRGRLEALAASAVGTDVRINGDIHFTLLPQPHIEVTNLSVGPKAAPVMVVQSANADLSLMDFLRDRYSVTKLVLDHPVLDLTIGKDGGVATGLRLAGADSKSNLSVSNARIEVGRLRISDTRSGTVYSMEGIQGDLTLSSIRGPGGFEGGGSFGAQHYNFRLTSAAIDATGNAQLALFAQPDDNRFSINADGTLATGSMPHFTGNLNYRQSPAGAKDATGVVGDLTLTGKLDATPAQLTVGDMVLTPDENRAVTRLTGTTTFYFGATPKFAAVLSSDLLSLPPRDATKEQGPQPYELVRLLGELPVVPVPPMAGTLSANVAQLDLRSFTLGAVRLAAETDGKTWSVKELSGRLPGNTRVTLAGELDAPDGRPNFAGSLSIAADRLDTLSTLWRKPAGGNPLFGLAGQFQSQLSVNGQTMALTGGQLTLGGAPHGLNALINFGKDRRIDVSGQFSDLSAADSAALLALAPDLQQDSSAAVTFPQGAVALSADSATLFGLDGKGLALEGKWSGGTVEISKFSAADLGGANFDLTLALSGTLAAPHIAGDGTIGMAAAGPALEQVLGSIGAPPALRAIAGRSLPADLKVHLDDPKDGGGQGLSISGKAGVADLTIVSELQGGLLNALSAPLTATTEIDSSDPRGLTAQLGLGDVSLLPETGPIKLSLNVDGSPTGTLKTNFTAVGGTDSIGFDGTLTPGDLSAPSGAGKLNASLSDTSVLAAEIGLAGLYAPPAKATADVQFTAGRSIALDNLAGSSGTTGFSGNLTLNRNGPRGVLSGALTFDTADLSSLVAVTAGPTSLMMSAGKTWPDGPLSVGDAPRSTTGSIAIKVPSLTAGGAPVASHASFDFGWDATTLGLHNFTATLGSSGTLTADVSLCCAGPLADKQAVGQLAVKGVALSSILPAGGAAAALSGTLDGSARFNGTGDSVESILGGMTGDGSFTVSDMNVANFDPGVFARVAALDNIAELDADALTQQVTTGLDQGPFTASRVTGGLTIAAGVVRASNVSAETPSAKFLGTGLLSLKDLAIGGAFGLVPVGVVDKAGLVNETTSKVVANLGGTLIAPTRKLDIANMVEAVKVKALEVEVARLEALKEADDARQRAATAARKEAREDQQAQALADALADLKVQAAAAAKAAADKAIADKAAAAKAAADKAAAAKAAAPAAKPFDLIPADSF